jgi:hypothetical protein
MYATAFQIGAIPWAVYCVLDFQCVKLNGFVRSRGPSHCSQPPIPSELLCAQLLMGRRLDH